MRKAPANRKIEPQSRIELLSEFLLVAAEAYSAARDFANNWPSDATL
jgi:hypothetical protein